MKTVEIEQTVLLTKEQYHELHIYLKKHFKQTESFQRFMMRFIKDKVNVRDPLDIRYKWTSGKHTLVIKKGALGSQSREEITIPLDGNYLSHFVQHYTWLGYKNGLAIFRETERFRNDTVEVSLTKAEPFYFAEAESMGAKTKKQAFEALENFFKQTSLTPLSKADYQKHLRDTDRIVNLRFPLKDFPKSFLENKTWKERFEKIGK
jgi:hypothetical protein